MKTSKPVALVTERLGLGSAASLALSRMGSRWSASRNTSGSGPRRGDFLDPT